MRYRVTIGKSTGSAGEKVTATAIIMSVIGRRDDRSKFLPVFGYSKTNGRVDVPDEESPESIHIVRVLNIGLRTPIFTSPVT